MYEEARQDYLTFERLRQSSGAVVTANEQALLHNIEAALDAPITEKVKLIRAVQVSTTSNFWCRQGLIAPFEIGEGILLPERDRVNFPWPPDTDFDDPEAMDEATRTTFEDVYADEDQVSGAPLSLLFTVIAPFLETLSSPKRKYSVNATVSEFETLQEIVPGVLFAHNSSFPIGDMT